MKNKEVPIWKIMVQSVFTILLVSFYGAFMVEMFADLTDDYRRDSILEHDLANGEYAQCYCTLDTYKSLYGENMVGELEFLRYKEFVEFYDNYVTWVMYTGYDENNNTNIYEETAQNCIDEMKRIGDSTEFYENSPHYEYLLEVVEGDAK